MDGIAAGGLPEVRGQVIEGGGVPGEERDSEVIAGENAGDTAAGGWTGAEEDGETAGWHCERCAVTAESWQATNVWVVFAKAGKRVWISLVRKDWDRHVLRGAQYLKLRNLLRRFTSWEVGTCS